MKVLSNSNGLKLASIGLLSMMIISGCGRKFSRLDSGEAGSSDVTGGGGGNVPVNPVGKNGSVTFNGAGSTYTEVPVVYVLGGNSFYTANPGSGAGYDGNLKNMTLLAPIAFTVTPASINTANISVVPYDSSQGSFCNGITFTMQNGFITLNNIQTNRLPTMTTCMYKLTSSSDTLSSNQLSFTFNYTVKDWASTLGNGTDAQTTANAIVNSVPAVTPASTSLNLSNQTVPDLTPVLALTNLTDLKLNSSKIKNIPTSINQLKNLVTLQLSDNQITSIPDEISQLTNLNYLSLDKNGITLVPDSIKQLSKMQNLYLQNNQINVITKNVYQWIINIKFNGLYGNPGYPNFGN